MNRKIKPLGELEQHVMEIVWREECCTVRCVFDQIKAKRDIAYTTVMTTMDRLTKKRLLQRVKVGKAYEYQPCCCEKELRQKTSRDIINQLISNYGDLAIAQFLEVVDKIDSKKLRNLRDQVSKDQMS